MRIESEAKKVAEYAKSLGDSFRNTAMNAKQPAYKSMGALIIDGILQAAMNHENVVRPRVEQFLKNYPDNKTVSEFAVAAENDGWEAVSGWEHKTKLGRIRALVAFLQGQKVETVAGLKEWGEVPGNPDLLLPVKGVGPKTRDYLLMMAGASTPAVDVHLKNFVREAGVTVSDSDYEEAKEIITTASKLYGVTPFQFDQGIWLYMAKKCNPNAEGLFAFAEDHSRA